MSSTAIVISATVLIAAVFLFSLYKLRKKNMANDFAAVVEETQDE
jgi:hypothetical protein